jgi:hypothetical protein
LVPVRQEPSGVVVHQVGQARLLLDGVAVRTEDSRVLAVGHGPVDQRVQRCQDVGPTGANVNIFLLSPILRRER